MTKVLIIHGFTGHPDKNWFPWLKHHLEEKGIEVIVPQMPNTDKPILEEWLGHLDSLELGNPADLYIVGHSLGCPTILRYLEKLPEGQKLAGAILVAGFAEPIGIADIDNFLTPAWDDEKIKLSVDKLELIYSDNDPAVPVSAVQHLHERVGGELIEVHNAGHFNWRDGFEKLPIVLDKLLALIPLHT